MKLIRENTSRKIDGLGRVSIPKGMRDRLEIAEGDEMEFFLFESDEGEQYVCLTNHKSKSKYKIAVEVLNELGLSVPAELEEKL